MPGDERLKKTTRHAYGKRKRRPPNPKSRGATSGRSTSGRSTQPDENCSPPVPPDQLPLESRPGPSTSFRLDTTYYTAEEIAARAEHANQIKRGLETKSATQRKFDLLEVDLEHSEEEAGTEFVVVDMAMLRDLFAHVKCGKCGLAAPDLRKADRQYGLAVKLEVTCSVCKHRVERFSSPRTEGSGSITPFEVNIRALKSIQSIGKGVTALGDFCAGMNLSHRGLHHKTFQAHLRKVVQVCEDTAAASEADSVRVVKDLYSDLAQPANNIDVMFDGTWMTRGRSSHIGVGCIIEVYTGLVIDHVVLSNFCLGCVIGPKPSDEGYEDWLAEHECQKNIDCGAGRMEVEAALIMFKRSLSKNGLRYTTVMSDGDSRTMHSLKEEGVYGFVPIEKKDCINHVCKRMHTSLRSVREKKKAQGETLGGRGKLTDQKIRKIASYYGYALRSHAHDVPAMQKAVQATLRHMASTDDGPNHSLCPDGPSSWCKYNRAVANGEEPPAHKDPLPDSVRAALEPIFARLSDEALLERCADGKTQNASECLHSVIWTQASKNQHASLLSVTRAVAEAVSVFNRGRKETNEGIASGLGYTAGNCLLRRSLEKDKKRLKKSTTAFLSNEANKRKLAKRHQADRSADYSPGQF